MSDWKDSAQEISELALRYLRPLVESAEAAREEQRQREATAELTGDDTRWSAPGMFALTPSQIRGLEYMHRPAFAFVVESLGTCLMRDDGAVFVLSGDGEWMQHSALPGTPAARPDDASER